MNKNDWSELIFKFCSIFLFIAMLSQLPSTLSVSLSCDGFQGLIVGGMSMALILFLIYIAYAIWKNASSLSQWMWKNNKSNREATTLNSYELQYVVFSGIGLYIIISTLPHFIGLILDTYITSSQGIDFNEPTFKIYVEIISVGIKLVLGAWLILGTKGIIKFLRNTNQSLESDPS